MKKSEWNEALNHIDNDIVVNYVAQKENLQKKKKMRAVYIRLVAISACLAIIVTAVFTVPMLVERGDGGVNRRTMIDRVFPRILMSMSTADRLMNTEIY